MALINLPGYAEALKDDSECLRKLTTRWGDTVGLIKGYLEDELESHASEMELERTVEIEKMRFWSVLMKK